MRLVPALIAATAALGACNSDPTEQPAYEPAESVAVTAFSIAPNVRVMANLDSVFFSIDLDHGVIFNADSLPAGTKIDRLVPKITFPSTVTKAEIEMSGGTTRTGTVNYKTSPNDSIDFSGSVHLTLATADDALSKTYTIKVNVHKMVADSLMWDRSAVRDLPSRSSRPLAQRTVNFNNGVYTFIEEADGAFNMVRWGNLTESTGGYSDMVAVDNETRYDVATITPVARKLYALSKEGVLAESSDGSRWQPTGMRWKNIIGAFGESLLGIVEQDGVLCHDIWPRPAGYMPSPIPDGFPTSGMSEFHSFTSQWAAEPIGLFVGGMRDGKVSGDTWAYDGADWACISNRPLPQLQDVLLVPYFNYRQTATSWIQTEFSVLLAIGGRRQDGSVNRTVYLSYDNGVNWMEAESLLQLPAYIPSLYDADAAICNAPMEANLDNNWKVRAGRIPSDVKRIQYFTEGSEINWECPYIYLFGGYTSESILSKLVWRAVLARLTFTPIF